MVGRAPGGAGQAPRAGRLSPQRPGVRGPPRGRAAAAGAQGPRRAGPGAVVAGAPPPGPRMAQGLECGAGVGLAGQRVSLSRRLDLRPWIGRNRLCHSLGLTSPSLPRPAAAIGRAALASASSAGGFFKGEADPSARREPPPGPAQTASAWTPSRNFGEPQSSGGRWRVHLGGARRGNRAGACAPVGGRAGQRALQGACGCLRVPAGAWARRCGRRCARRCPGRAALRPRAPRLGEAGCGSRALAAEANRARPAGLTCAHAHWGLCGVLPPSLFHGAPSGNAPPAGAQRPPAPAPPPLTSLALF